MPYLFLNPELNANTNGFSDLQVGFKYALIACPTQYFTFQFRTYTPTGDGSEGLGTDHVSLEPALLWYRQLGDRLALDAEFRDWIPIGGTDFAGNIIRYGVGMSYWVIQGCRFRAAPIAEVVGWTCLGGKELVGTTGVVRDASGDTIVNAKIGLRLGFGEMLPQDFFSRSELAVSYGRALTGDVWYKDILRVEYRINF